MRRRDELLSFAASVSQVNWDNLIYPASVLLAELTTDQAFDNKVQTFLQKWVCRYWAPLSFPPSCLL